MLHLRIFKHDGIKQYEKNIGAYIIFIIKILFKALLLIIIKVILLLYNHTLIHQR